MLELAVDEFIKHWETIAAYPDHDDYSKGVSGESFYGSLVDRCGHDATPFLGQIGLISYPISNAVKSRSRALRSVDALGLQRTRDAIMRGVKSIAKGDLGRTKTELKFITRSAAQDAAVALRQKTAQKIEVDTPVVGRD